MTNADDKVRDNKKRKVPDSKEGVIRWQTVDRIPTEENWFIKMQCANPRVR